MHFKKLVKSLKERREMLRVTQEMLADLSGVDILRSNSMKAVRAMQPWKHYKSWQIP